MLSYLGLLLETPSAALAGVPSWLLLLLLMLLAVLASQWLWHRHIESLLDPSCSLPLPKGSYGLPFVGETLTFLSQTKNFQAQRRLKYGSIFKTHLFGSPMIRVSTQEDSKTILSQNVESMAAGWPAMVYKMNDMEPSPHGLVTPKIRSALRQGQSHEHMRLYIPRVSQIANQHINAWIKERHIQAYSSAATLTVSMMLRALFGLELTEEQEERMQQQHTVFKRGIIGLPFDFPFSSFRKAKNARNAMMAEINDQLHNRYSQKDWTPTCYIDLVAQSLYLENDSEVARDLTDDAARSLMLGGATGLFGSVLCTVIQIYQQPRVKEKIRDELREADLMSSLDTDLQLDDLLKLPYCMAVVKEILRVNPPIPGLLRLSNQTFDLKGFQVPKGWRVGINVADCHKSMLREGTEGFIPERFLSGTLQSKWPKSFLPFGHGVMMCPGNTMALYMQLVFLVELARRAECSLDKGEAQLAYSFTQFEKDSIPTTVVALNSE